MRTRQAHTDTNDLQRNQRRTQGAITKEKIAKLPPRSGQNCRIISKLKMNTRHQTTKKWWLFHLPLENLSEDLPKSNRKKICSIELEKPTLTNFEKCTEALNDAFIIDDAKGVIIQTALTESIDDIHTEMFIAPVRVFI